MVAKLLNLFHFAATAGSIDKCKFSEKFEELLFWC